MPDRIDLTDVVFNGDPYGDFDHDNKDGKSPIFIDASGYISIDYDKVEDRRA